MEKKRLTLTGNKIPEGIYKKLEELGTQRKLTPYVVNLIEKEEKMDLLIKHLSVLTSKVDNVEQVLNELNQKFDNTSIQLIPPAVKDQESSKAQNEVVKEGRLEISKHIEGGIDEEIDDMGDF